MWTCPSLMKLIVIVILQSSTDTHKLAIITHDQDY